jgi:nucleotide-binding universal stress UspA family protein
MSTRQAVGRDTSRHIRRAHYLPSNIGEIVMSILKRLRSGSIQEQLLEDSPYAAETARSGPGAVLVGIDGSDASLRAWAYAAGVARVQNRRLVCMQVKGMVAAPVMADTWDYIGNFTADYFLALMDAREEAYTQIMEDIVNDAKAWGTSVDIVQGIRPSMKEVRKVLAEEANVDMLVMAAGTRIARQLGLAMACGTARRWPCTVVLVS